MRDLFRDYFDGRLPRRDFLARLVGTGLTAAAARTIVEGAGRGTLETDPSPRAVAFTGTGGELLVEQIRAAGSRYIFTNPGSLEVGLFDALVDRPDLQLVVGLHEGIVIGMADAYHKVSRQPTFVNVHAAVGTAQMAGQMYNAHFDNSGLIVTAGLSDNTVASDDMVLAPRPGFTQAEINRQFTKISWEVRAGASAALAIRRAYKLASTPPGGPVYVAFSTRALAEQVTGDVWSKETFLLDAKPRPAADQIDAAARLLLEAERPIAILGDEIFRADAAGETIALCELLGIPMAASNMAAFQFVSSAHPLFLGTRAPGDRAYPYGGADLVVQIGARELGAFGVAAADGTRPHYVAIGLDTNMIGRTRPVDVAVVGDVKAAVKDLVDAVRAAVTADRLAKLRDARGSTVKAAIAAANAERLAQARRTFNAATIHPDQIGYEMERELERNAIVVTENNPGVLGKHDFLSFGPGHDQKLGVGHGGGSLGWGVGASVGAKLAAPDRQVVLSIGDGSLMYSAGGFWSMARHHTPVLTIVWNNHNYQTVRNGAFRYNRRMAETGKYPGLYLGDPDIDFVKLAGSQGVGGERVTSASDVAAALRRGTAATRSGSPYLIEFVVARFGGGAESTWYQNVRPVSG